ncbi:pilus assembly PilX N-terminal domain-containing protein [bacterium]|nr:pilus assembly PilX N-terminal domain-containing protein [bacterium]
MRKKKNKDKKIISLLLNQKGMALLTTLIFVFILVTFAVALLTMTSNDTKLSALQRDSTKAFYIAEAGIERTLYNLKEDFKISKDWDNKDKPSDPNYREIHEYPLTYEDENGFRKINYAKSNPPVYEVSFGDGTYTVALKIIDSNNVTIKSKGKYDNSIRYVQVDATVGSLSIWDNAIFAGTGASGRVINGNVDIRGSVHILGEELDPDDPAVEAIEIGGTAGIGNNYIGMHTDIRSRIISPPTTVFNGETVETLKAKLRVKRGKVNLSGTATVGDPNVSGNVYKETLDGVYVTDGFGGNQGEKNVYSDNGTKQPYDFGEGTFHFPTLDDPYIDPKTGSPVPPYSYKGYYDNFGLKITDISSITSNTTSFHYPNPEGDYIGPDINGNSIRWDQGTQTLKISGIIVIEGDDIDFTIGKKKDSIKYSGTGTIVSKKDISINSHLLAKDLFPTTDALGLIAYKNINLVINSQLNMMGAFYAQEKITSSKQNEIAGTFVSNYFDMSGQVPSIYQVPGLENNLPPGMPGATITYTMHTSNWHEVYE